MISQIDTRARENHQSFTDQILVTGFQPWASIEGNPSSLVAESLNGTLIQGRTVTGIVLPVDFSEALQLMHQYVKESNSSLIICLGLAPGSSAIQVETIAFNVFYDPYEEQLFSSIHRVNKTGPFALFSTIKTKETVTILKQNSMATDQSYFAGFYLCNALFYESLHLIRAQDHNTNVGFIHLPQIARYGNSDWVLDTLIDAVTLIIEENLD